MSNIQKEGELPKVTNLNDNDSIRITLADGRSGSIKKTDLVSTFKDALGQLLGNSDPLSLFTNVIVNNDGVLGKATIENLASVVSGANVKTWTSSFNISDAPQETYNIKLDGITIPDLNPYALYGAGLSIKANDNGFQIIISNNASGYRYWQGGYYSQWFIWFQH